MLTQYNTLCKNSFSNTLAEYHRDCLTVWKAIWMFLLQRLELDLPGLLYRCPFALVSPLSH